MISNLADRPPISYLNFTHHYMKLDEEEGTTIRMSLKDKNGYVRRVDDIIWMIHIPNVKFKAQIIGIEKKRIEDIPLFLLKKDVAPFQCNCHEDFIQLVQSFYKWQTITKDTQMYIIYWRRIE